VKVGDRVQTGQAVGQVGNSGNSTEPHLHIQIKKGGLPGVWSDGEGAPMIFGGNFLVRGDLARATQPAQSA
ncbi:MAG TPA: M23 family metallopeptidase, partial [Candidatus Acidoferrum sp.]|nr:M23 family metallopeptidase [Candidatus Acidoferrum sp.]